MRLLHMRVSVRVRVCMLYVCTPLNECLPLILQLFDKEMFHWSR